MMRACGSNWCGLRAFAIAALLLALVGCGGTDRPKTIAIGGVVTIDGKAPGEGGKIFFTPTEAAAGYSRRPASGSYTRDGNYRVMSWAPDDGLVPGHYTVHVVPGGLDQTTVLAKSNAGGGDIELDVPVDKSKIEFNIDVKTK